MNNRRLSGLQIDLEKPWLIEERRARSLLAAALKSELQEGKNDRCMITPGGTKIIQIRGPLFRYENIYTEFGCGVSYDWIYDEIQEAVANTMVRRILFVFDSPGGEVDGLVELADYVVETDARKPVYSHVSGTCASAAYWLASATRMITSTRASYSGCIGALAVIYDDRRALEGMGVDQFVFVSSVSPNKFADPKTDSGKAQIQRHVDETGQIFVDFVSERRSLSGEEVITTFGAGDVLIASQAKSVGMIDEILNTEKAIVKIEGEEVLGIKTEEVKDNIDENMQDGEPVEEEAQENPEDKPEDKPEEEAQENPEEKPEEEAENEIAAFMISHKEMSKKLISLGAEREQKRIRSVLEATELHAFTTNQLFAALKDGKSDGKEFLMSLVKSSKKIKQEKIDALNKDADKIETISGNQNSKNSIDALENRAVEHARTLGVKTRR